MKRLGMIAGMSPESTTHYYEVINKTVCSKLGGNHSAEILMSSVNFQEIVDLMDRNDWNRIKKTMIKKAILLEPYVDGIIICTNTIHKIAGDVQKAIDIPLIHIGKVSAEHVRCRQPDQKVGLLGTSFTMKEDFIKDPFFMAGIDTITPDEEEMEAIDTIIFQELCRGIILDDSRKKMAHIIDDLQKQGARGIVLACTELQMIVKEQDLQIPVFDTMKIHAEAAAEFVLSNEK
ncbi:MAG: amino acid racemase [Candidatus Paceibacterota bacterium]|jgi:aspartate racemase